MRPRGGETKSTPKKKPRSTGLKHCRHRNRPSIGPPPPYAERSEEKKREKQDLKLARAAPEIAKIDFRSIVYNLFKGFASIVERVLGSAIVGRF